MKIFIYSLIIPLFSVILILLLHFSERSDTMLNQYDWSLQNKNTMHQIDQTGLQETIEYHKLQPTFARRPLSTYLFEKTASILKIQSGTSFILVSFLLLFFCGIFLFFVSLSASCTLPQAIASQCIFYSGFSILCVFFNTNYSYDEPLNYFLFFLSMLAFNKNKIILFSILFFLSALCREIMYLLIPAILIMYSLKQEEINRRKRTLFLSICFVFMIATHFVLLKMYYPSFFSSQSSNEMYSRMSLIHFNFQNINFAMETFFSFVLVMALPIALLIRHYQRIGLSSTEKPIVFSFVSLVFINTIIVLFSTIARESRLFAPPLLLMYPLLGMYLYEEFCELKVLRFEPMNAFRFLSILAHGFILMAAYLVFYHDYETTIQPTSLNLNREYLLVLTCCIVTLNCIDTLKKNINAARDIYK